MVHTYRVCMVYDHVYSKLFVHRNSIPSNKMLTKYTDYTKVVGVEYSKFACPRKLFSVHAKCRLKFKKSTYCAILNVASCDHEENARCVFWRSTNQEKEGQARNLQEMGSAVRSRVPDGYMAGLRYGIRGRSESCDEAKVSDVYQVQAEDCGKKKLQ